MKRTYVFTIKIVDREICALPDDVSGEARIHIYVNTNVEAALQDLHAELQGGYEINDIYSEPFEENANSPS